MRKTVAKRIRKLIYPSNPIARRVYRRLKKAYVGISGVDKKFFFAAAEKTFGPKSE